MGVASVMARPAESSNVRPWDGVVASADDLDERRVWVVWGLAAPPEYAAVPDIYPRGSPANDLAIQMASERDPEFAAADELHRWIMLVQGDEDDVDAWVLEHPIATGCTAYLIPDQPQ